MELHNQHRRMCSAHRGFRSPCLIRYRYMSQHFDDCHLQRGNESFHDQYHNLYFDGAGHYTRGRTVTYDVSSNAATFTPTDPLALDTLYTATITTGAQDLAGAALASDYVWTFTTSATACTKIPSYRWERPAISEVWAAPRSPIWSAATAVTGDIGVWPGSFDHWISAGNTDRHGIQGRCGCHDGPG